MMSSGGSAVQRRMMRRGVALAMVSLLAWLGLAQRGAAGSSAPVDERWVRSALRDLGDMRRFWMLGAPASIEVHEAADGYRVVVRVRPAQLPAERLVQISLAGAAAWFRRAYEHPQIGFARLVVEQEFVRPDGTIYWDMALRLDVLRDRAMQVDWRLLASDVMAGEPGWEAWLGALSGLYIHPALAAELKL